ncbi:unnamed protein product [Linum tenue]|uniref:Uncharacterized protein n=1 Tax=Linum tenue TaxID=586396 RepID=A0AAV0LN92_9ROSI|nr:unnamed protein product [Linum tenue]
MSDIHLSTWFSPQHSISFLQANERLQSLTEEISRIGTDVLPMNPQTVLEASDKLVPRTSDEEEEKDLEDYARPVAVVGVSVLKGVRVKEMLKQIRAALRQCRDSE